MRITHVKKARKDQGYCSRCRDPLPVGSPYRWIKFRFGGKIRRCMKYTCRFRGSDMTTSDKRSDFYLAQEQAEDALEAIRVILSDDLDADTLHGEFVDLASTLGESADLAEQVRDGFEESAMNLEEYFSGSYQIDEINEKSQAAEEYAGELQEAQSAAEQFADRMNAQEGEDEPDWSVAEVEGILDEIDSHVSSGELP
jgi:methyl-accepting chemotaxis protein